LIAADANKQHSLPGSEWSKERDRESASRAVKEYLATLDDVVWGAASEVTPKFVSPSDPAAQWTGAMRGPAFIAYADNYLIDVKFGIIVDVEASRAIRQAEVGAAKTMIKRTEERFNFKPDYLAADTAYGSAATLNWLVTDKKIAPHIPVIDKSKREDGTFSREDFTFDKERDVYTCPAGNILTTTRKVVNDDQILYRASKLDCDVCPSRCNAARRNERQKAALAYAEAIVWHLNTDDAFWDRMHREFSEPELVELGCMIGLTLGQQSWLRLLNIEHHEVMAGNSASMAPGYEDGRRLAARKAERTIGRKLRPTMGAPSHERKFCLVQELSVKADILDG
jgi:hypothetical protein